MSLRLRFFKLPKHSVYSYKPRYWDPDKEDLEERLQRVEDLKNGSVDAAKARISGGFKKGGFRKGNGTWNTQYRRKHVARSNKIFVIVLVALGLLTFYFLTRYMPTLANLLDN